MSLFSFAYNCRAHILVLLFFALVYFLLMFAAAGLVLNVVFFCFASFFLPKKTETKQNEIFVPCENRLKRDGRWPS